MVNSSLMCVTPGQGQAMYLLIHGGGMGALSWATVTARLKSSYRVAI